MTRTRGILGAIIVVLALIAWWVTRPAPYRHQTLGMVPPSQVPDEIDHRGLTEYSLKLNGEPFGSVVHQAVIGSKVTFTHLLKFEGEIDKKAASVIKVVVRYRPAGASDSDWTLREGEIVWDWLTNPLKPEESSIEEVHDGALYPGYFLPGDYDLRAYLVIRDMEGGDDTVQLLDKAKLSVSRAAIEAAP